MIDSERGVGTLATVFVDRVLWFAAKAEVDPGLVLGRAVAHEIGHLVLGTTRHTITGLMRAVWSREELKRNRPADWQFTSRDRAKMSVRFQSRLAIVDRPDPFSVGNKIVN